MDRSVSSFLLHHVHHQQAIDIDIFALVITKHSNLCQIFQRVECPSGVHIHT
jgi:hypothetical protein